jgi:RNA polymerase sigma factor (TIGR02999 family)
MLTLVPTLERARHETTRRHDVSDITQILQDARWGRPGAHEQLASALYEELRSVARRDLAAERPEHTLQPTALVNEAWLRLFSGETATFENRAHFFGAAATAIRRVLTDHARRRQAEKRGGARLRVPLDEIDVGGPVRSDDILALDDALERMSAFAPLQARIVEMKFFGGLSTSELARALSLSESTIQRNWRLARAWLRSELDGIDGR